MKYSLFLFMVLVVFYTTISNAQDTIVVYPQQTFVIPIKRNSSDSRSKFYIGLKGGYNYSNIYDVKAQAFNREGKIGFATGVFFTIPIAGILGIQPEILFSQKGFHGTGNLLGNRYEITRRTNFIDVPFLIALKPTPFITLLIGPQFSYLMKQRDQFEGSEMITVVKQEFNNDHIRKKIISCLSGVDFNFTHIIVSARVGWDTQYNATGSLSATPRYKNIWVQATMGVRL